MDTKFMQIAIELAKNGAGFVNPNPKVGAVIVKYGKIIGQGFHQKYGENHAEINAINSAKESCEGATIYVTLEPCNHYGKTPPCVDAIIKNKFSRVVIGMKDPNPKVAGKSIQKLLNNGIKVTVGILEKECINLNPEFIKLMVHKTPYVVMKTAMTLDGKIATKTGESKWITGESARQYVHILRHELQGIMVGVNTVIKDDCMLTARRQEETVQPIRIVIDSKGRTPINSKIVKTASEYKTIIVTTNQIKPEKENELIEKNIHIIKVLDINGKVDLSAMMIELGKLNINSILLEGGGTLNYSMLKANAVDEIIVFVAPKLFGGIDATTPVSGDGISNINDAYELENLDVICIGADLCIKGKVVK